MDKKRWLYIFLWILIYYSSRIIWGDIDEVGLNTHGKWTRVIKSVVDGFVWNLSHTHSWHIFIMDHSRYIYMYNIDINPKSKPLPGHGKKQITAIKQKYSRFKCKPLNHWKRKAYIPRTFLKVCLRRNRIKTKNRFLLVFVAIMCALFSSFFCFFVWWCEFRQCYK